MKKSLLILGALPLLLLASCSDDKPATQMVGANVLCYGVPADGSRPTVSLGQFQYDFNFSDGTMQLSVTDAQLGDQTVGFITPPVTYTLRNITNPKGQYIGQLFSASTQIVDKNNNADYPVSDVNFNLSTCLYGLPTDFPGVVEIFNRANFPIVSFKAGTAKFNTMPDDAFYGGQTNTVYVYNDQHREFSSTDPLYRLCFRVNPTTKLATGKADLVIYNARFASEMPMPIKAMALTDLDVTFGSEGYVVSGTNVVPKVLQDGTNVLPNERFEFDHITISSQFTTLTKQNITFSVAGKYQATCTASYLPF